MFVEETRKVASPVGSIGDLVAATFVYVMVESGFCEVTKVEVPDLSVNWTCVVAVMAVDDEIRPFEVVVVRVEELVVAFGEVELLKLD